MNENLCKVLSIYCNNEIEKLKNSELYIKLQKLVDELKYVLVCKSGVGQGSNLITIFGIRSFTKTAAIALGLL